MKEYLNTATLKLSVRPTPNKELNILHAWKAFPSHHIKQL